MLIINIKMRADCNKGTTHKFEMAGFGTCMNDIISTFNGIKGNLHFDIQFTNFT